VAEGCWHGSGRYDFQPPISRRKFNFPWARTQTGCLPD
jgi:hypothetical protein